MDLNLWNDQLLMLSGEDQHGCGFVFKKKLREANRAGHMLSTVTSGMSPS